MYFDYSEEHQLLRDAARGYLETEDPIAQLRGPVPLAAKARRDALEAEARFGWTGMLLPEDQGGAGVTAVEAMVLAEEYGRAAHSAPFAGCAAAGSALAERGSDAQRADWLPEIAAGRKLLVWASAGRDRLTGKLIPGVEARRDGDGWRLSGFVRLVQDADIADALLVDARSPHGLAQFLVPADAAGLAVRVAETMDISRLASDVRLDDVILPAEALLGPAEDAEAAIARQLGIAAMLTAADSVGAGTRLREMTVDYTRERLAFGKPVASFQAVKHRCADMLVRLEGARVATCYAAIAVRDGRADLIEATSIAKFHATEAAMSAAGESLQLHGAIGMAWEHDVHILLKRIKTNEMSWGTNAAHRATVAAGLKL